jgi:hypothetical protein
MAQMGHEGGALALEVYSKVMERRRDTGERMDALVRSADWAQTGTNCANADTLAPVLATENPAGAGFREWRRRESNPRKVPLVAVAESCVLSVSAQRL